MLNPLTKGLWVAPGIVRFLGSEIDTRMTVVALEDGGLWLHSPVALDPALKAVLDPIGPVAHVLAPCKFHHLGVGDYVEAYPDARIYAAPGLPKRRRDLHFHEVLSDEAPSAWSNEIDQLVFWGLPFLNEVVFCHRPSRTLVVTDLLFNVQEARSWPLRLFFRLDGAYRKFGLTRLTKLLIRDPAQARADVERILGWDFDRIILTHGEIIETGGKEAFRGAFAWL